MAVGLGLPMLAAQALAVVLHLSHWSQLPQLSSLANTALSKRCMLMVGLYGVPPADTAEKKGSWQEYSGTESALEVSQLQLKLAMAAGSLCQRKVRPRVTC